MERICSAIERSALRSGAVWLLLGNSEIGQNPRAFTIAARPRAQMPADGPDGTNVHTHTIDGPTGALSLRRRHSPSLSTYSRSSTSSVQISANSTRCYRDLIEHSHGHSPVSGISMVVAAALLILFAMRPLGQLREVCPQFVWGTKGSSRHLSN